MGAARNERLYRERGFVPVRILHREVIDGYLARGVFSHPCPCNGWRLDDKRFGYTYEIDLQAHGRALLPPMHWERNWLRREAKRHIDQFLKSGTMDGAPR